MGLLDITAAVHHQSDVVHVDGITAIGGFNDRDKVGSDL
jgi:hypothetical protein